ncbi:MAG TPA: TolC family protein, partial [Burkholderiales bacterium]|nr:TolC family protein [Burkholderiales bacterium]
MRRSGISALVCGLLAGCMVGPDYHRPQVETPDTYSYEPEKVAETANTEWWKQFNDPVLDQLIEESLANNKNVKIAAANVEQAAGVLTTTGSPLYPQIGYQADASRQRLSENSAFASAAATPGAVQSSRGVPNPFSNLNALATASWEIDLWGRIRRQTEAARANLLAT